MLTSLSSSQASQNDTKYILGPHLPTRFILCVRSAHSVARVNQTLKEHAHKVEVVITDHVAACKEADIIILACDKKWTNHLLQANGLKDAIKNKLFISTCASVSVKQI